MKGAAAVGTSTPLSVRNNRHSVVGTSTPLSARIICQHSALSSGQLAGGSRQKSMII
jgi:hypothetical protein